MKRVDLAAICDYVRVMAATCDDVRVFAVISDTVRFSTAICDNVRFMTVICDNVRVLQQFVIMSQVWKKQEKELSLCLRMWMEKFLYT